MALNKAHKIYYYKILGFMSLLSSLTRISIISAININFDFSKGLQIILDIITIAMIIFYLFLWILNSLMNIIIVGIIIIKGIIKKFT